MASTRKRGNSYQITVSNGYDVSGKKIIETTTYTPDSTLSEKKQKESLDKFVFEFEQKVKRGKLLKGDKLTLKDYSEQWWTQYAEKNLEKTTLAGYRKAIDHHIKQGIYSTNTIKKTHAVLSSMLSTAVRWQLIKYNPCDRVKVPMTDKKSKKIRSFTIEQTQAFLEAIDRSYPVARKPHTCCVRWPKKTTLNIYAEALKKKDEEAAYSLENMLTRKA